MKISIEDIAKIAIAGAFGAAAVGFLGVANKQNRVAKKLDMSLSDISKRTPVEIQDSMLQKATDLAVKRAASDAAAIAIRNINNDMNETIRADVDKAYEEIQGQVENRVNKVVDNLDVEEIKSNVTRKLEAKIFNGLVDSIGLGRVFGSGGSIRGSLDTEGIKNLLDQFPQWQRAEILETILNRDGR